MKRILSIALTLGLALLGSTAVADPVTHIVRIEGPGYFPDIIYYKNGDYVKFENHSNYVARLRTTTSSSSNYYTNLISKNSSQTLSLGTTNSFALKGPYLVVGSSYFGGTSYAQYNTNYGISFVKGEAPTSCPDTRVVCD